LPKVNPASLEGCPQVKPGAKPETSKMVHFDYFNDDSLIYSAV